VVVSARRGSNPARLTLRKEPERVEILALYHNVRLTMHHSLLTSVMPTG
jgi:hypothetical protein